MASDPKGSDGPDPKDVQKTAKDLSKQLDGLMLMHKALGAELENLDQLNDQVLKDLQKADAKKQQERWKQMQDTQTKIFDIMQDVTREKAKLQKNQKDWDQYIRG